MKKLIVWDIDGTLWDGLFIYDSSKIELKPGIKNVIQELDNRGIIQSIISRNPPAVLDILKEKGVIGYFVFPKVGWQRKHNQMAELLQDVHILPKDVVFVDNEPYERELMKTSFPEIATYDENQYTKMLDSDDFKGDKVGHKRRDFFKDEEKRMQLRPQVTDDNDFFDSLDVSMSINKVEQQEDREDIMRLINRANQLHATGNKFNDFSDFNNLYKDHDIIAAYPSDKFGDYGLSLACVLKKVESRLDIKEIVISCRVIDREMIPSYLSFLQEMYDCSKITIQYKKTLYNSFLFEQFKKIGFLQKGRNIMIDIIIKPKVKILCRRIYND